MLSYQTNNKIKNNFKIWQFLFYSKLHEYLVIN